MLKWKKDKRIKGGEIEVSNLNKLLNESYKKKKDTSSNIDNRFILDENLSTDKTKVYLDNKTGDIKMVNRGTSDFKDVFTDAKLLMGFKDKSRFNEARGILNEIKNKYPQKSIDVYGHSLGASVAEDLGKDERIKNVITLNKPTTPKDLLYKSKQSGKQYDIRTTGDLISILNPLQQSTNDIIIPSETKNPYTEHKIETLSRLPQDQIIGTGMNYLEKYIYDLIINELKNLYYNNIKDVL